MFDYTKSGYIGKLYYVCCVSLFLWFFYLTSIQIYLPYYNLDQLYNNALIFIPTLIINLILLLIYYYLSIKHKTTVNLSSQHYPIPFYIFIVYLIWCFVTVLLSMQYSADYLIGYGYLMGYIMTFINLGLVYKIMIIMNSELLKSSNKETLSHIAFISSSLLLLFILINSLYDGSIFSEGRKLANLMPATIGLISLPAVIYPIIYGFTPFRLLTFLISAILVYHGSSRTAILSIIIVSITIIFIKKRNYSLIVILMGLIILLCFPDSLQFLMENVLLEDDYYRGLDTLSGRRELWEYIWNIFLMNPITGYGFRMSEVLFFSSDMASAHNAYLSSLIETGIVGTVLLLTAVMLSLGKLAKYSLKYKDKTCIFYFSILFGSMLIGLGERFIINIGNLTSILCMFPFFIVGSTYHKK